MEKIIAASVLFLVSTGWFILSFRSFRGKGYLLNNAYIYASKQERECMDKKPYYRQSAVIFLLLGIAFGLDGAVILLEFDWLLWLVGIIIVAAIVYAIVSSILMLKR